ncbi:sulfotransferase family protein [Cycloclasticus sp. P1]|uniref:sulfotransferase family protein n=1 Tax=Cycloclasticus sp. (strain P1) TaxID=385025 RepID=UPI000286ABEC|nr:sulfotransferase family protein [Cycloclasticus sp. P1]AFT68011.1 hypothetical protein Q91_1978 [Cycloclasticus sp. P1]
MDWSKLKRHKISGYYNRLIYSGHPNKYTVTISDKSKFVWYQVAKVGTRTILNTLKDSGVSLSREDAYKNYISPRKYKDYYKFAFIRNPYDRLVSCWLNKVYRRKDNRFKASDEIWPAMQTFSGFIDFVETLDLDTCDDHIRSQSSLIDLSSIDFIGRMESFEEDLDEVFKLIGVNHQTLTIKNVTKSRKDYQAYYTDTDIERVFQLYKKDIRLFGYDF